jgi:hypothetical protein
VYRCPSLSVLIFVSLCRIYAVKRSMELDPNNGNAMATHGGKMPWQHMGKDAMATHGGKMPWQHMGERCHGNTWGKDAMETHGGKMPMGKDTESPHCPTT